MMIAFICWCAANTMIVFGVASPCFLDNLSLPQKDSEKERKVRPWESTSSSSSSIGGHGAIESLQNKREMKE
jgi:hypothetical protein